MTAQLIPTTTTSTLDRAVRERLRGHLAILYGPGEVEPTLERLWWMMEQFVDRHGERVRRRDALFDERDVTLIT